MQRNCEINIWTIHLPADVEKAILSAGENYWLREGHVLVNIT